MGRFNFSHRRSRLFLNCQMTRLYVARFVQTIFGPRWIFALWFKLCYHNQRNCYLYRGNSQTTIHVRGDTSFIPSTGYESAQVTCLLGLRLNGNKISQLVIFKGKDGTIHNHTEYKPSIAKGLGLRIILRSISTKCSHLWCGDHALNNLLGLSEHAQGAQHECIFDERRIDQVMITSGCTMYLHSLDIAVNRSFKGFLRPR
jgi:hypothetical protein